MKLAVGIGEVIPYLARADDDKLPLRPGERDVQPILVLEQLRSDPLLVHDQVQHDYVLLPTLVPVDRVHLDLPAGELLVEERDLAPERTYHTYLTCFVVLSELLYDARHQRGLVDVVRRAVIGPAVSGEVLGVHPRDGMLRP